MRNTMSMLGYLSRKYNSLSDLCRRYKISYRLELRRAKIAANEKFIENADCKPRALWQVVKSMNKIKTFSTFDFFNTLTAYHDLYPNPDAACVF